MTKKFYSNPKCKVYPISLNEKMLDGSDNDDGTIDLRGGTGNGTFMGKERNDDFSWGIGNEE